MDGIVWLAIGDSITEGTGSTYISGSYTYLTKQQIKSAGTPVFLVNSGIGGMRSDQILGRYKFKGGKCDPDLVTVMIGTNDVTQAVNVNTFKNYVSQLIDDVRSNSVDGSCIVVLCTIPFQNQAQNANVATFNSALSDLATTKNAYIVDTNAAFSDASYLADTVHPNDNGHQAIANILTTFLLTIL